ncbi:MAG: di-trans,poly-cis-decaprenylcistransferase [Owenweeksia sp.]|nr:di-trans,poly-cis-decaprenylcistransferase [Owenweeksia sp.]MBF99408.1 di-trans,poly-cis-decaprenylcistransferase [Owenweeksia sp.]|tara:strand:+ start:17723 stop:18466 length:744 start_codon:yes stop_codon:yes gene_type:complete
MSLKEEIKHNPLPQHVAIIMDGNGRWAKKKGFLRAIGHENGVDALRNIATASAEVGIKYLTVYAFSSENWNRPRAEVNALMALLVSSLRKELKTLTKNNISLNTIGKTDSLPLKCQRELQEVIEKTSKLDHMTLTLALSYGSREEITEATRTLARDVKAGKLDPEDISEEHISHNLFTRGLPDPDLLIRTSGEYRISNYMLWQIAYSELYFTDKLWPDFGAEDLFKAILDYQRRERRFGKISEQLNS